MAHIAFMSDSPRAARSHPTILIVDDKAAVRRLIQTALRKAGFSTLEAADAQEALAMLSSHAGEIALVVTELVMPQMGGLDLANAIEMEQPGLKVLYISGYCESVAAQSIASDHPEVMLLKPFSGRQIVERVRALLEWELLDRAMEDAGNHAGVRFTDDRGPRLLRSL
jgi:two-component system cell cycle sensor histidine kinase/response regulator CckA